MEVQVFQPGMVRPTAAVISHERSGTHFLINTLSASFNYLPVDNRLDVDTYTVNINFFAPEAILEFFNQIKQHNVANVLKSHHSADFLEPVIETAVDTCAILYIYRHPRDVMHSMWRLLKNYTWHEGPVCPTPADMMRAQPEGHLMRYQMYQAENMLHRWDRHVNGWFDLAEKYGSRGKGIHLVRYEDLRDDYEGTVKKLGADAIGCAPTSLIPPNKIEGVIVPQAMDSTKIEWQDEDLKYIETTCAKTLERLGYS
ncbi:sulfotransferase domain-containing protein [Magnetovibrio sp. PR-2]|uniref:sulfotransferase domain-containing protein n=1 Tax=Magnetovibrio sp. PR-2 TaxID=3120356 RepID=UPI002FCDEDB4